MKKNHGFTLIELLVVIGIIAILMAMVGTASFIARRQAYKTQARAEAGQVLTALKAIWIARENNEIDVPMGEGIKMTDEVVKDFGGYLEINTSRLNEGGFLDPWGNHYEYSLKDVDETELIPEVYQISVSFLNTERFYYQGDETEE